MNVVTKKTLQAFWTIHPTAKGPLTSWYDHAKAADWQSPQDIKNDFRSVDFVGDNRVIFDIGGNNYRLVVRVSYTFKQVLVKFVGTTRNTTRSTPRPFRPENYHDQRSHSSRRSRLPSGSCRL